MGCCVSTNASENNRKRTSKSPPPTHPLQEEEAVKEVLSETPTAPRVRPPPAFLENGRTETPFIKNAPLLKPAGLSKPPPDQKNPRNGDVPKKSFMVFGSEEASEEISEICSTVSESVSVSTSVTEKKDNYSREHDVVSKIRNSSPARAGNQLFSGDYKRDRPAGKSPYRRSEPSPGKNRAGPVSGSGRRKDGNEELPARRSRSPMMRADSGSVKRSSGRIQTARGAGKSPSRVVNGSGEKIRKLEEEAEDNREQQWPMTGNELLENPLVSLECFIFL